MSIGSGRGLRVAAILVVSIGCISVGNWLRAEVKTDYGVHPAPSVPPALPAAGGIVIDPVFGSRILRVTSSVDGTDNITAYSYWPSFNRNSTRIRYYVNGSQAKLATFNPATLQVSNKRDLFLTNSPDGFKPVWEDVIWSGTDPDVIYGHTKLNIWAYNVVTNTYTLIHNFANDGIAPGNIQQMSRSANDNVFAFTLQNTNYQRVGHIAWQRDTNQIKMHRTDASNVNEVSVDKTGRYVLIHTEQQGAGLIQARVMDLQTGVTTDLLDNGPHFAPGHGDLGRGVSFAHENWQNRIMGRSLATPTQPFSIFQFPDWTQSMHLSMLADDEQWALVSTYGSGSGAFSSELFLVATDGSGRVKRFAHHESDYNDYYDSPRADISADGRFVAFTSNWGNINGRRDVFVAEVPQATSGPTTVSITATDPTAAEPTNTGLFTLSRTGSTASALTVNLARSGNAIHGTDYNSLPTNVTFNIGSSTATLTVTPKDEQRVEGAETVTLALSSGTGYTIGTPSSATVTINDNEGTTGTASITGNLFNDSDSDGVKDTGEAPLSGWRVYLDADTDGVWDANEKNVLTNSSGVYTFTSLPAGVHRVREVLPSGWRITSPSASYHQPTLSSGQALTGQHFANTTNVLIAGLVFNDANGDKSAQSGEAGLANWQIQIDTDPEGDGSYVYSGKSATTGTDGKFSFKTLPAGRYRARIVQKAGYTRTTPTSGYISLVMTSGQTKSNLAYGEKPN